MDKKDGESDSKKREDYILKKLLTAEDYQPGCSKGTKYVPHLND